MQANASTRGALLFDDDGAEHPRTDAAAIVISSRRLELEREVLLRSEGRRTEQARIAEHGMRLMVEVHPGDGRARLHSDDHRIEPEVLGGYRDVPRLVDGPERPVRKHH